MSPLLRKLGTSLALVLALAASAHAQAVRLEAAVPAFDPKLQGAALSVQSVVANGALPGIGYEATLAVEDGRGVRIRALIGAVRRDVGRTYTDTWTGHDDAGLFVAPGPYDLVFTANAGGTRLSERRRVYVVRLGFAELDFESPLRVPLVYLDVNPQVAGSHVEAGALGAAWSLPRGPLGRGALDEPGGAPLALPAPWLDPRTPPVEANGLPATTGRSLPLALAAGAATTAVLRLGSAAGHRGAALGCGYPLPNLPLRVRLGGAVSGELSPGGEARVALAPTNGGVRRDVLALEFTFEVRAAGRWVRLPGSLRTLHPLYVTLALPTGGRRTASVAALDLVARLSSGQARDPDALAAAITRGLYGDYGLRYDDWAGASAYTLSGFRLAATEVDLASFLADRRNGRVVNCLDLAGLTSALARHAGAEVSCGILGWEFSLHWIQGVGGSGFRHDLFGGRHGFSYHAFATLDGASHVYDACLRVDVDGAPHTSPFLPALPLGMRLDTYVRALSPDFFVGVRDVAPTKDRP